MGFRLYCFNVVSVCCNTILWFFVLRCFAFILSSVVITCVFVCMCVAGEGEGVFLTGFFVSVFRGCLFFLVELIMFEVWSFTEFRVLSRFEI